MERAVYTIKGKVWIYAGQAAWHFAGIDKKMSEKIKKTHGAHAKGWGSLPVYVTLGKTRWKTSIFPDKRSGTYLLPLKASVRAKEGIREDDTVTFSLEIGS